MLYYQGFINLGGIQYTKKECVTHHGPEFSIKVYRCAPYRCALMLAPLDYEFHPELPRVGLRGLVYPN